MSIAIIFTSMPSGHTQRAYLHAAGYIVQNGVSMLCKICKELGHEFQNRDETALN
ncbi:MAG: hypothetical protein ACOX6E_00875 [Syntrophomonadaceae bacterium]